MKTPPKKAIDFLIDLKEKNLEEINSRIKQICGINDFFSSKQEYEEITSFSYKNSVSTRNKTEYGDFQTSPKLTREICEFLHKSGVAPEVLIEPTCGTGNFILASLQTFPSLKHIYGIEIYKPYVWETKKSVLEHFLQNPAASPPEIYILHSNIFDFDITKLVEQHKNKSILILGNPPWVTNSQLSAINSYNLPKKSNFKKHKGMGAITGKGNFDIGEYISLKLLSVFSFTKKGYFAFLVKRSVVRNILQEQKRKKYLLAEMKQFNIDAKKEFGVSVNACLFICSLGRASRTVIEEYDFYTKELLNVYGWENNKFVANRNLYKEVQDIDGKFPFVWRQGIKHDAAQVMELQKIENYYINKQGEKISLEEDLIYGLLKSSDLKGGIIEEPRRFVIIPQKKLGEDTRYIQEKYPETYKYLSRNIRFFQKRKSKIYKNKPPFSIFGIGEYAFMPYKVAISGMYKTTKFSLVKPYQNKPIMLDDTCYFIGFDTLIEAEITRFLLNLPLTQKFLQSITFKNSKRMLTKEVLMRINLSKIIEKTSFEEVRKNLGITETIWQKYTQKTTFPLQRSLFSPTNPL